MPTYDYRCTKCGHKYEKFQKISDDTRPRCPECGGKGEREISGGVGIHFKGSGFYVTDYGKSGAAASPEGAQSDKPEKKKSDSKPAKPKGDDS